MKTAPSEVVAAVQYLPAETETKRTEEDDEEAFFVVGTETLRGRTPPPPSLPPPPKPPPPRTAPDGHTSSAPSEVTAEECAAPAAMATATGLDAEAAPRWRSAGAPSAAREIEEDEVKSFPSIIPAVPAPSSTARLILRGVTSAWPQPKTLPSAVSASVCRFEAETATARAAGGSGAEEEVDDEEDDDRLFPENELEAFAASASASTRLGTPLAAPSVVPYPSWPRPLAPQVQTTPRESAQAEWRLAAASATTRCPRSAGSLRGEATESGPPAEEAVAAVDAEAEPLLCFFEEEEENEAEEEELGKEPPPPPPPPRPSLPSRLEPQAHAPPSAVAASEWCFPRATTTTRREVPKALFRGPPPPLPPPPGKSTCRGSMTAPKEGADEERGGLGPPPFFAAAAAAAGAGAGSSFSSCTDDDAEIEGEIPHFLLFGGTEATSTAPCPSLPPLAAPQVHSEPSSVTAAEWNLAAATWQTLRSTTTSEDEEEEEEEQQEGLSASRVAPRSAGTLAGRASPPPVAASGRPSAKWPLSPQEKASPVGCRVTGAEAEGAEGEEREGDGREEVEAAAATSSGVLPRASGRDSEAPPRRRAAAAGAWPKWRARWRAVLFVGSRFFFRKL